MRSTTSALFETCAMCRFGIADEAFGCYGYPITAAWMQHPAMLVPNLVAPSFESDAPSNNLIGYLQHVVAAARAKLDIVSDG